MIHADVRWKQRLANYRAALAQLHEAAELAGTRPLSRLEKQGLIQGFEMVFELSWNLIRDYFVWQGETSITGSRDAIRHAFKHGIIHDGEQWMEMLKSRNLTLHTYNEQVADRVVADVLADFVTLFSDLEQRMAALATADRAL